MRRYMKADLKRIYSRKPRIIAIGLIYLLLFIAGFISGGETVQDVFVELDFFSSTLPVVFGVLEIAFIYGDDFKAKTMQIAIGTGLPRQKVVHAKWLDFMVVTATDLLGYFAVACLSALCEGALFDSLSAGFNLGTFPLKMIMTWIAMITYLGSIMFILFWMQGIGVTLILYIIMATGVVPTIIKFVSGLLKLTRFHLHTYTLTGLINTITARLVLGFLDFGSVIGILIYMMISFALASILFKKKELEF